jgi:hypothetical protein
MDGKDEKSVDSRRPMFNKEGRGGGGNYRLSYLIRAASSGKGEGGGKIIPMWHC